jgi:hypothetical protein
MAHPLNGCYARTKRASRYIHETEQLIVDVARECEEKVIVNPDGTMVFDHVPQIPPDLPLAISDAIHNTRAALDYLVYQLAKLDSGQFQSGTQFPIEDHKMATAPGGNKIGFDITKKKLLKGLNPDHISRIEDLQPYKGVNWTKNLRDISNPDKHRDLTPITSERMHMVFWIGGPNGQGKRLPNGDTLQAQPEQAITIVLPSGNALIVPTLWKILGCTVDTINAFNAEFPI